MRDIGLICIGAMITIAYSVYIAAHVISRTAIPNGALLSGVIGALCAISGIVWGKRSTGDQGR